MKNLSDYSDGTTASELYAFLTDAVVEERITSFSALMEYTACLPRDARFNAVIPRIFKLIRKLHWGFFRDIDVESFPKVWREVVIPDREFKNCGALKRNLTISDVYVGILDLHGYTRFCEKNKNNLSMLQMLDDMIQVDIVKMAKDRNVVLQRRQGDEMVLVGASACDLIATTLMILDYFSKRRTFNVKADTAHRSGYKIILEEMHISAGIAGGKKFTPFIITRDGDLSGGVVNTAARLQGRANELSSSQSRILVSRTVSAAFQGELKAKPDPFFAQTPVKFFDSGWISFKGISVAVYEVLYTEADRQKLLYEPQMTDLYRAVEGGQWKDGVFDALAILLIRVIKIMPKCKVEAKEAGLPVVLRNAELAAMAADMQNKYRNLQDYVGAISSLEKLVGCLKDIPSFDKLCLEYASCVLEKYLEFAEEFGRRRDVKIDERALTALPAKHKALYDEGRRGAAVYGKLREHLGSSLAPLEISLLWSSVVDEAQGKSERAAPVAIYSGKK